MRAAALLLLAAASAALAQPAREPTKNELLFAVEKQLRTAYESAGPSVACVVVSRSEKYPRPASAGDAQGVLGGFAPEQFLKDNPKAAPALARALDLSRAENIPDHGFACAVVIDAKGLLLTPFHVVEGATKIYVHLPGRAGSYADIHAGDARTDLAVLRLLTPPADLKPVKFADVTLFTRAGAPPSVSVGKLAVVVANPYASHAKLDKPSAALGSVSKVRHHLPADPKDTKLRLNSYYDYGPLIEHDAKLNTGISGAALLNLDGELIGLTTTAPVLGLGDKTPEFAFPLTEQLLRVIEVLRRGEEVEGAALGVSLLQTSTQISAVPALGPTARSGIRPFDTITHINGVRISSYDELLGAVGTELAGTKVTLTVRTAQGRDRAVALTLSKWQHDRPVIASGRPAPVFGLRVDHDSALEQSLKGNQQVLTENANSGVPTGVAVRELVPDSPAAAAFKKLGDRSWLVTHVNGTAVASPGEFYAAAKGEKSVKLTVIDPAEAKRPTREVTLP